jgi:hypothetical protein
MKERRREGKPAERAWTAVCGGAPQKGKKEKFPGPMKHAAWELLSPDLRCFCNPVCGKLNSATRLRKEYESK